jgi:hypothetical protein
MSGFHTASDSTWATDLTKPQWSLQLTGTHMDAIYHTSIVLEGVEYYFGHGIQMAVPGSTHHGQPMERVHLGKTELPTDVIAEYIQSLEEIYTPEASSHSPIINNELKTNTNSHTISSCTTATTSLRTSPCS